MIFFPRITRIFFLCKTNQISLKFHHAIGIKSQTIKLMGDFGPKVVFFGTRIMWVESRYANERSQRLWESISSRCQRDRVLRTANFRGPKLKKKKWTCNKTMKHNKNRRCNQKRDQSCNYNDEMKSSRINKSAKKRKFLMKKKCAMENFIWIRQKNGKTDNFS